MWRELRGNKDDFIDFLWFTVRLHVLTRAISVCPAVVAAAVVPSIERKRGRSDHFVLVSRGRSFFSIGWKCLCIQLACPFCQAVHFSFTFCSLLYFSSHCLTVTPATLDVLQSISFERVRCDIARQVWKSESERSQWHGRRKREKERESEKSMWNSLAFLK